jgi:hypothetical protein
LLGAGPGSGSVGTGSGGRSGGTGTSGGMFGGVCSSILTLVLKVRARIENCLFVPNAIMGSSTRSEKTALIFEDEDNDEDDYETHPKPSIIDYSRTSTPQTLSGALALAPGDRTLPVEHRDPGRAKLTKDGR